MQQLFQAHDLALVILSSSRGTAAPQLVLSLSLPLVIPCIVGRRCLYELVQQADFPLDGIVFGKYTFESVHLINTAGER
jgi:hypothetical protein